MPLSVGDKLGPYEIVAPLGAGGMGEVYRARDTRLGRDVAIKVLPDLFAGDPNRMARFEREAQVLASLNHPHIAHVYGAEQRALVMELVEGETLACPLPVKTAVAYARQIIDALEYAHERSVIHRDLKPANIKVTPDGVVKLLDFGLAKVLEDERAPSSAVDSPTLTLGQTRAGVILGTAAYMSPEQAVGKAADRRSDIFSFGAVLYEMLTGSRAFAGESAGETLVAVAKDEPDWGKLPPDTPPALRTILRRALVKERRQRLQAIGEARILLDAPEPAPAPVRSAASSRIPWAISALLLAACGVLAVLHFAQVAPPAEALYASISRQEADVRVSTDTSTFIVSPDGAKLAYTTRGSDGERHLWVQPFDSPNATRVPEGNGAGTVFWSPDSRFVAALKLGQLNKIDLRGGSPETVARLKNAVHSGAWNTSGVMLLSAGNSTAQRDLYRISAGKGEIPEVIASGEGISPQFLPDQTHYLYVSGNPAGGSDRILAGALNAPAKESKPVGRSDGQAAYARGFLLFLRSGTLLAQPFDPVRLETSGEAVPLAQHVASFSVAEKGPLVYQPESPIRSRLTWVDRSGKPLSSLDWVDAQYYFALSPDGKTVALSMTEANRTQDIWLFDLTRGSRIRFSSGGGVNQNMAWAPDGSAVIWDAFRKGKADLFRKPVNGTGAEELLFSDSENKFINSISPDGKFAIYGGPDAANPKPGSDMWVLPLEPGGKPRPFLQTPFREADAVFSPDGKWVAYDSDASGLDQVYVAPFPGPGTPQVVSTTPGRWPRWRPDSKELFWRTAEGALMAAPVTARNGALEVGREQKLFGGLITDRGHLFDFSADGQRILIAEQDSPPEKSLMLVQNWTSLLKKK